MLHCAVLIRDTLLTLPDAGPLAVAPDVLYQHPCLQLPSSSACQPHGKADDLGPRYNYPSLGFYTTIRWSAGSLLGITKTLEKACLIRNLEIGNRSAIKKTGIAVAMMQRLVWKRNLHTLFLDRPLLTPDESMGGCICKPRATFQLSKLFRLLHNSLWIQVLKETVYLSSSN